MFSGIVQEMGRVAGLELRGDVARLTIEAPLFENARRQIGESICISGVCLTVVALDRAVCRASFDLASETRRCTTLGLLEPNAVVNLEPSLQMGDAIHGHFVQGHVDATSPLLGREEQENTIKLIFERPPVIADLIAPKGSVALDGVSLTVGEVERSFSVYIIPHTAAVTTLGSIQPGDLVNVEADCLARYVKAIVRG